VSSSREKEYSGLQVIPVNLLRTLDSATAGLKMLEFKTRLYLDEIEMIFLKLLKLKILIHL
jgi:hypothetical protein